MRTSRRWTSVAAVGMLALSACLPGDGASGPGGTGRAKLSADVSVLAYTPNLQVRLTALAGSVAVGEAVVTLDTPGNSDVALEADLSSCAGSAASGACTLTLSARMLDPQGNLLDEARTTPFTLAPGERRVLTDPLILREISRLVVSPATLDLEVGQSRQLSIQAQNVLGQAVQRASPPTISLSAGGVVGVSPSFLVTAVGAGSASATFTQGGRSVTLPIQVRTPPRIAVNPANFAFARNSGDTVTTTASASITNTGQVALTGLTATVSPSATWLRASLSGTSAPAQLGLSVNARGLAPGTYGGSVLLSVAGRTDVPTVSVTVSLTVRAALQLVISPSQVQLRASQGGPLPSQASVTIREANGLPLGGLSIRSITDSVTGQPADVSWLSFTSIAQAPVALLINALTTQPAGTRRVRFEIVSSDPAVINSPQFLDLRYDIVANDSLIAAPSAVQFTAAQGDTLPSARSVNLTSSGSPIAGLTVASVSQTWLAATLNGTVTPTSLALRPNTTTLPPGTYSAVVTLRSSSNPQVPDKVIPVTYVIAPSASISGRVVNGANGVGLGGALVTAFLGSLQVGSTTTAASGTWSLNVPSGSGYRLAVSAPSFTPTSVVGITVGTSSVTAPSVPLSPAGTVPGTITGVLRSATTGLPIAVAGTVELRPDVNNVTGTPTAITASAVNGTYTFSGVAPGTYTLVARVTGFTTGVATTVSLPGGVTNQDILLSPLLAAGAVRIVLSWGSSPFDLDAHLTYPLGSGRGWVYYASKGICGVSPVCLDVDDTSGFGPETITISTVSPGVYRFYVQNFSERFGSGGAPISASGAIVEVYQGGSNTPVRTFAAPQLAGDMWHVFDLNGTTITPVNQMIAYDGSSPPRIAPEFSTEGRFLTDDDILRALFLNPPAKAGAARRPPASTTTRRSSP